MMSRLNVRLNMGGATEGALRKAFFAVEERVRMGRQVTLVSVSGGSRRMGIAGSMDWDFSGGGLEGKEWQGCGRAVLTFCTGTVWLGAGRRFAVWVGERKACCLASVGRCGESGLAGWWTPLAKCLVHEYT